VVASGTTENETVDMTTITIENPPIVIHATETLAMYEILVSPTIVGKSETSETHGTETCAIREMQEIHATFAKGTLEICAIRETVESRTHHDDLTIGDLNCGLTHDQFEERHLLKYRRQRLSRGSA
jgi:hypothetical protein